MQAFHDISAVFAVFGPEREQIKAMSTALGEKVDTVCRWRKSGRIPERAWTRLIEAVKARGQHLTADDMLSLNASPEEARAVRTKSRRVKPRRVEARAA